SVTPPWAVVTAPPAVAYTLPLAPLNAESTVPGTDSIVLAPEFPAPSIWRWSQGACRSRLAGHARRSQHRCDGQTRHRCPLLPNAHALAHISPPGLGTPSVSLPASSGQRGPP